MKINDKKLFHISITTIALIVVMYFIVDLVLSARREAKYPRYVLPINNVSCVFKPGDSGSPLLGGVIGYSLGGPSMGLLGTYAMSGTDSKYKCQYSFEFDSRSWIGSSTYLNRPLKDGDFITVYKTDDGIVKTSFK